MRTHWILVGEMGSIPQRGARKLCTRDGPVAIFRTSEDDVFALADRCPHRGGPLSEGIVSGRSVTCPLHSWNIDLASGEAAAPDEGHAQAIPVKVEDGMIFVALQPADEAVA